MDRAAGGSDLRAQPHNAKPSEFVTRGLIAILSLWLLWTVIRTGQHVAQYYDPLPIWDYWRVVDNLPAYEAFDLRVLWQQHNEHRIVFPELAFACDMLLARGRMVLPIALNVLLYFGTWVVMSSALADETAGQGLERWATTLRSGIVALFETCAAAVVVPFLLQ